MCGEKCTPDQGINEYPFKKRRQSMNKMRLDFHCYIIWFMSTIEVINLLSTVWQHSNYSKAMAVDALRLGLDALYFYGILLYSGLRCPSAVALKLSAPQNW